MFNVILTSAKERYRHEMFHPSLIGLFINPFYFSRKGLVQHLTAVSKQVTGKVLDVGCGNKPYMSLYRADQYVGLEIDSPGNRKNKLADEFYDGNIFPFQNESFDSVVSNQVFEHVPNPDQFLSEISRVLKKDGTLLMTAPFVWDEHEQPHDYTRYSSFGIRSILARHGFEVIELRKSVDDIRIVFQLLNAYIYKKAFTRYRLINFLPTVCLIAPINLAGEVISWILPRNADLYLDNIVLAKKAV